MSEPSVVNVFAIVVTYLPEPEVLRRLLMTLELQVANTIIVDNTPMGDTRAVDACIGSMFKGLSIIRLGGNQGVARALNVGILKAMSLGASHVLLSDQDSLPANNMVVELLRAASSLTEAGERIGALGPTFTDRNTGVTFPFQAEIPGKFFYGHRRADSSHPIVDAISLITSGSLISVNVIKDIGLMREDFFIDNVDVEWCHRARAAGYSVFGVGTAVMYHALGDRAIRVWYLGWRLVNSYGPIRVYYQVRNFVALCRMSHVRTRWKWRNGWYCLGFCYSQVVFGKLRLACLTMALRGLMDGLRGRMGPWRG